MVDSSPPIVSLDVTSEDNTEIEVSNLETPIDVFIDCDMKSTGVFVKEREVTGTQFASVDVNTGGDTVALRVQLIIEDVIKLSKLSGSQNILVTFTVPNYKLHIFII